MANARELTALRYQFWEEILDRKHWVMYLQPPILDLSELREVFSKAQQAELAKVIQTHTKAFMVKGKEPPAEIAGAIKNFADDIASGREVTVRAGDYIAVQNFMRAQKKASK
ncbi:hypothetical protein [Syntrophobacter fumaroxidans]|uniref:Uncharacterized protein n=1 Tax=Syntrophobacter fumaroxidans (strain DSM 10017 / MPOB) TaxID=335543 RepID=A0LL09_SYNFM|nr:hypothetical protein [Syntrophobacter fumaroxidans]ABK18111.1 hypothetical protein Sfum_2431 [Syntrophobacter fumaroxidans MPOB]HOI96374.1 hypothetical protein [Syntrophobacter fumaroxidans]